MSKDMWTNNYKVGKLSIEITCLMFPSKAVTEMGKGPGPQLSRLYLPAHVSMEKNSENSNQTDAELTFYSERYTWTMFIRFTKLSESWEWFWWGRERQDNFSCFGKCPFPPVRHWIQCQFGVCLLEIFRNTRSPRLVCQSPFHPLYPLWPLCYTNKT